MVNQSIGPNVWKTIMNQRNKNKKTAALTLQAKYRGNKTRIGIAGATFSDKSTFNKAKKVKALKPHLQRKPRSLQSARRKAGLRVKPLESYVGWLDMPSSFWTQGKNIYYLSNY